jgi:hypothetical protein
MIAARTAEARTAPAEETDAGGIGSGVRTALLRAALLVTCLIPLALMVLQFAATMGLHRYVLETDFLAFYTGGRMLLAGVRADLYDPATQYLWQRTVASEVTDPSQLLRFPLLPFVALPLAVVATLPFETAYLAWLICNLLLLAVICRLLSAALEPAGRLAVLRALALTLTFLPVMVTVMQGQWSLVLVLGLLASWASLRSGQELRGGLWLALLLVKPHYVLVPALALAWQRRRRALAGLALGCSILLLVSLLIVGWSGLEGYVHLLLSAFGSGETRVTHPQRMHTWLGFLYARLGMDQAPAVRNWWLLGDALALGLLLRGWRRPRDSASPRFDLQWALLAVVMLFVSPRAYFHDASLLIVAGVLIVRYLAIHGRRGHLDKLLAALPLVGYLAIWATLTAFTYLRLQLSVLFTLLALLALVTAARRPTAGQETGVRPEAQP